MFKEGDKVRQTNNCSGAIAGEIYTLTYGNVYGNGLNVLWAWKGGELKQSASGCSCSTYWELVEEKPFMKTLKSLAKRLLDKDLQTLYKVDYINGEGLELTEKGKNALLSLLFVERKAELVKEAEEELAEEKK